MFKVNRCLKYIHQNGKFYSNMRNLPLLDKFLIHNNVTVEKNV